MTRPPETSPPSPPAPDEDGLTPDERQQARLLDQYLISDAHDSWRPVEYVPTGLDQDLATTARLVRLLGDGTPAARLQSGEKRRSWDELVREHESSAATLAHPARPAPRAVAPAAVAPAAVAPAAADTLRRTVLRYRRPVPSRSRDLVASLALCVIVAVAALAVAWPRLIDGDPKPTDLPALAAPTDDGVAGRPPALVGTPAVGHLDADGDGYYTFDELRQAVAAALPTYTFPSGYRTTPDSIIAGYDQSPTPGAFPIGYEQTLITLPYSCAWMQTWVMAYHDGGTGVMAESLDRLRQEAQAPQYTDAARQHLLATYDLAAMGEPQGIQTELETSCTGVENRFVAVPSADGPS